MQKVILAVLVCGLLGYVVYQNRVALKLAAPAVPTGSAAAAGKNAPATGKPGSAPAKPGVVAAAPGKPAGPNPVRAQVEPLLAPLKVTSIMLGDPAVVIINKQDFGVGDRLPLTGTSRQVKVAAIDEAGVTLTCEGETFHLAAPGAPELAGGRKKL